MAAFGLEAEPNPCSAAKGAERKEGEWMGLHARLTSNVVLQMSRTKQSNDASFA